MTEYSIHLDPLYGVLEQFDVQRLIDETTDPWYNQTLIELGGVVVRLGVMQGEFHWHHHDDQDELFLVLDGEFHIQIEDRPTVVLHPRQGYCVPRGVRHRPIAPVRTAILMLEQAGIAPTGDPAREHDS